MNRFLRILTLLLSLSLTQVFAQVTMPSSRIVFQRGNDNMAFVPIQGNAPANSTSVQVKANPIQGGTAMDWTTAASASNGFFSGKINLTAGWYQLEVRSMSGGTQTGYWTVDRVGVGEVIIVAGQSNAQGNSNGPDASDDRVSCVTQVSGEIRDYQLSFNFQHLDGAANCGPTNNKHFYGKLGDLLVQRLNVPVLLLGAAIGGTSSDEYANSANGNFSIPDSQNWDPTQELKPYKAIAVTLNHYARRTGLRGILWFQGESDKGKSGDAYYNNIATVIAKSRSDIGKNIPWVISQTSWIDGGGDGNITAAQSRLVSNIANCFAGPNTDAYGAAYRNDDNTHFSDSQKGLLASIWNNALTPAFFNSSPFTNYENPATVTTGLPTPGRQYAGGQIYVSYMATGPASGASYTIQLLDEGGNFISNLGSGSSNPIRVFLPDNLGAGRYRVQAVSSLNGNVSKPSEKFEVFQNGIGKGSGTGLTGNYYANLDFSGTPNITRVDGPLDYTWVNPLGNGMPGDNRDWTARWTGQLEAPVTGTYSIKSMCDDGSRIYINNQLVIDDWNAHPWSNVVYGNIYLEAGKRYDIKVEMLQRWFDAQVRLYWGLPGHSVAEYVPIDRLYPSAQPAAQAPVLATAYQSLQYTVAQSISTNLPANFTDPANLALTYSYEGLPAGISANGLTLTGTPTSVSNGQFTIKATNSAGLSASAQVTYQISTQVPVNHAPVVMAAPSLPAGTQNAAYTASVAPTTFSDPDGNTLTYSISGLPGGLSASGLTISGTPTGSGNSTITIRATDTGGLFVETTAQLVINAVTTSGSNTGTGLLGTFYNNVSLTAPFVSQQVNPTVNYSWNENASPFSGVNATNMSVRWSGQVEAPVTGTYTFSTNNDDAANLWVNGQLIVSDWPGGHSPLLRSGTISLVAGQKYTIKLEFVQGGGGAQAQLLWSYPGQAQQIIPQTRLYPDAAEAPVVAAGSNNGTGLLGTFYNNTSLAEPSVLQQVNATVNYSWNESASSFPGVNATNMSVRWSGQVEAPFSGVYTFSTNNDDATNLWVNGQQLINDWPGGHGAIIKSGTISLVAGQKYTIKLEFNQGSGGAQAQLLWNYPNQAQQVIPQGRLYPDAITIDPPIANGTGNGLQGTYWNNTSLSGSSVLSRVESTINFSWVDSSPFPGVNPSNMSAHWEGQLEAPVSGVYTISTNNDDATNLWVNGQQLINDWPGGHSPVLKSGTISLVAGQKYTIKLEFNQGGGGAQAQLLWSYPGQAQVIIPKARLYSTGTTTSTNRAPVVVSTPSLTAGTVNVAYSATVPSSSFSDPDGNALTYSISGLPAGLSASGLTISGTPTNSGSSSITIRATDTGGLYVDLTLQLVIAATSSSTPQINPANGRYEGYVDGQNCNTIGGWVYNSSAPNDAVTLEVIQNASIVKTFLAQAYRSDLVAAGKGNGYHGYSFATPDVLKTGSAVPVTVRVSGTNYVLVNGSFSLNCPASGVLPAQPTTPDPVIPTVTVKSPQGYVDISECGRQFGWARDAAVANSVVNVIASWDNVVVATFPANLWRNDLGAAFGDNGYHAFQWTVPANLKTAGNHKVSLWIDGASTPFFTNTVGCTGSSRLAAPSAEELALTFRAFPNPTRDIVKISVPTSYQSAILTLTLLSLDGRSSPLESSTDEEGNLKADISTQPAGLYLIRVDADSQPVTTLKILKQ